MRSLFRPLAIAIALSAASFSSQADTLSDIYELALKNDATLKAAQASYNANMETEKQAFAAFLPQISANASHTEVDTDSEGFNSSALASVSSNLDLTVKSWDITVDQNIFDLPTWFSFQTGKELSKQAEAQFSYDQQDVIVRVVQAYFEVLRALDNLEASKAEERATKRQLEQTQQRFDVGLIAITDVHEARAVFDNTVVQRLTDEGSLGTSYEDLTILTGQPHNNLWLLNQDFPIIDPSPTGRSEWVDFALSNNYALKAAQFAQEAARQNATAQKMQHAPTLTGRYQYADNDQSGKQSYEAGFLPLDSTTDGSTWTLNLSVPIFTGGFTSSVRRQAYEDYNFALQTQINTQRTVVRNVRSSHITVTTDVQRVKARKQAIVSTSSALDATQAGYEVGTRNIVDVLQAQRALYASIRDYANSRYNYVINLLSLKRAAGILTPQDMYDLDKWMIEPSAATANQYSDYLK